MKLTKPEHVTGAVARNIRREAGMSQAKFWSQFGVNSKSTASYYENEKQPINSPIRHLIYLKYGCSIPVFASHAELVKIGKAARDIIKQRKEVKENGKAV